MTNGKAIRQGLVPCEANPLTGGLSYTFETFHAQATHTVGKVNPKRHVCDKCKENHFRYQKSKPGILWE